MTVTEHSSVRPLEAPAVDSRTSECRSQARGDSAKVSEDEV